MQTVRSIAAAVSTGLCLAVAAPSASAAADCKLSAFVGAVSAERVEAQADAQHRKLLAQARESRALAPDEHPQLKRLRYVLGRLLPFAAACNPRAAGWTWEINLIGSRQVSGLSWPGGKLAVSYGALSEPQLSDDEAAQLVAHLMAHVLLEHTRKQLGRDAVVAEAVRQAASMVGLESDAGLRAGVVSMQAAKQAQDDEVEADGVALVLAANAGYAPDAARTGWERLLRLAVAGGSALATHHPGSSPRTLALEAAIEGVRARYDAAAKPDLLFGAPRRLAPAASAPP